MKWKCYRIGEVFSRFSSGKNITESHISDNDSYPVYGGNGVRGFTDSYNFDGECVLIGRQGAKCGNVRYFKGKAYMSDHAIVGVCTSEHCTRFLQVALSCLQLNRLSGQAAQPGLAVNMLKRQKILLPTLSIQEKISTILSAYDDLIENNNRRIKILEQMAENLYKEWFVRFRFPGYEQAAFENGIPKGWERVKLSDIIDFNPTIRKTNQSEYKVIPMSALSNSGMLIDESLFESSEKLEGSRSRNGDTLLARITPCLENGKTGFVQGLKSGEVVGGSTEFIVLRAKAISQFLVYFIARDSLFRGIAIASMNGADGRQRVKTEKLKRTQWIKPDDHINAAFEKKCAPIFGLIYKLYTENQNLTKQRDKLLPRLMSGKLEV